MQIGIIADSKYVLTGEYGEGSMNKMCIRDRRKEMAAAGLKGETMLVCLLVSAGIWILVFLWFGLYEGRQCND